MINKHTLLDNKLLTNSANLLRDMKSGCRALVTSGSITHDPANGRLTDFFDIIIAESIDARNALGFSDIVFYTEPSAYKDGLFAMDDHVALRETILMTNFNAIRDLVKLKKNMGMYNLNYVPTNCACSASPGGPMQNELNVQMPGVHLALLLGCTTVYSDHVSSNTTSLSSDTLKAFLTAKNNVRPANILSVGRFPFIKAGF